MSERLREGSARTRVYRTQGIGISMLHNIHSWYREQILPEKDEVASRRVGRSREGIKNLVLVPVEEIRVGGCGTFSLFANRL